MVMASLHDSEPANLKGKKAEQIAALLSADKFYPHYTYLNPEGADGKEICDVLVLFRDKALVVQIKDNNNPYKPKNIKKNAKQCSGASRQILQSKNILRLTNLAQQEEQINLAEISRTYLLALHFDKSRQIDQYIVEHRKSNTGKPFVHFLDDRSFKNILEELRTLPDFLNYLEDKETLLAGGTGILTGSEQDLLARWIFSGRSFDKMQSFDSFGNTIYYEDLIKDYEYTTQKKDQRAKAFCWERSITELLGAGREYPDNYKTIASQAISHTLDERAELGAGIKRIIDRMSEDPKQGESFNGCMSADGQNELYVVDFTIVDERKVDVSIYEDYKKKLQRYSFSYFHEWEEGNPALKIRDKSLIALGYLVNNVDRKTGNFRLLRCAAFSAKIRPHPA